jgi:hypothetical protein
VLIRFPLAMFAGVTAYMIAMMMTTYDGVLSMIVQPIMGVFLTAIALTLLIAVGSPLLFLRAWRVWRRLWAIPLIICFCGTVAMVLSCLPAFQIVVWNPDRGTFVESADPALAIGGWLAMLFGILYQPRLCLPMTSGRWM